MEEFIPLICGLKGTTITKQEEIFLRAYRPWGIILFERNCLSEDQITTISSLSGVQEFPMRIKCATMAWHTLLSALEKKI